MSNQVNTELLELAQHHIEYWAGKGIAVDMESDIKLNDLEKLEADLKKSANLMFDLEYYPDEAKYA